MLPVNSNFKILFNPSFAYERLFSNKGKANTNSYTNSCTLSHAHTLTHSCILSIYAPTHTHAHKHSHTH